MEVEQSSCVVATLQPPIVSLTVKVAVNEQQCHCIWYTDASVNSHTQQHFLYIVNYMKNEQMVLFNKQLASYR